MYYNRKQRREFAKQLGLIGKKESFSKWHERILRGIEAGKQLHNQFVNETENSVRKQMSDREARVIKNLSDSLGQDVALEIVANNRAIDEKRRQELRDRRIRQSA